MNNENLEDYAVRIVKELRDRGDLIASFFLCSTFVEHYCKTKLKIFIRTNRPAELIEVEVKRTKERRKAFIYERLDKWIDNRIQGLIIELGLLVGAWNKELYNHLTRFNKERNDLAHEYENLLQILDHKDEKKVRSAIDRGLSLLHDIKRGYVS